MLNEFDQFLATFRFLTKRSIIKQNLEWKFDFRPKIRDIRLEFRFSTAARISNFERHFDFRQNFLFFFIWPNLYFCPNLDEKKDGNFYLDGLNGSLFGIVKSFHIIDWSFWPFWTFSKKQNYQLFLSTGYYRCHLEMLAKLIKSKLILDISFWRFCLNFWFWILTNRYLYCEPDALFIEHLCALRVVLKAQIANGCLTECATIIYYSFRDFGRK